MQCEVAVGNAYYETEQGRCYAQPADELALRVLYSNRLRRMSQKQRGVRNWSDARIQIG